MKVRTIAIAVALTLLGTAAHAAPITFDSHPPNFGDPIFDSGFTFSFQAAGWGVFGPGSGACCSINYNGTPALYADGDRDGRARSVMSLTGGGTFSVFGFDAASYWQGASGTLIVIGSLSGGGTVSASFAVDSIWQAFTLPGTFTNLVSLTFQDSQSGAFLVAPGFGIDNIALEPSSAVPDAGSSLLLLGVGLAGLRAWRKRLQ